MMMKTSKLMMEAPRPRSGACSGVKRCGVSDKDRWGLHSAGLDNTGCAARLHLMEQKER